jgi:hypothetical protein
MGWITVSVVWVSGVRCDGVVGLVVEWDKIGFVEKFEWRRLTTVVWRDERAGRGEEGQE